MRLLGLKKRLNENNLSETEKQIIEAEIEKLERLLRGVYYVEELTDKTKDLILSYGERLAVPILAGVLNDQCVKAKAFDADNLGILTNGDFGNAVAILKPSSNNFKKEILPLLNENVIPIITGFFGCDNNGNWHCCVRPHRWQRPSRSTHPSCACRLHHPGCTGQPGYRHCS